MTPNAGAETLGQMPALHASSSGPMSFDGRIDEVAGECCGFGHRATSAMSMPSDGTSRDLGSVVLAIAAEAMLPSAKASVASWISCGALAKR